MKEHENHISLSYKDAGVDINAGNDLVSRIKPFAKSTMRDGVMGGLGGFGALFEVPMNRYQQPVLVSGTDGVGTKLKLAMELNCHDTIGIDLVAMCVNDLIVQGAEPLFFLDYYATGKLNNDIAADVIKGIASGCQMANCALIGGETAEMPGMYQSDDYDLAGFCVGVVEKSNILDGSKVTSGDVLLGLASSGPHSNGYSLIRKIIEHAKADINAPFEQDKTLGKALLEPTKIYVKTMLSLLNQYDIHAISHITGGGITENLPRVLPPNTKAIINLNSWQKKSIFNWLQDNGNVNQDEMLRTFNCGLGLIIAVNADDADDIKNSLNELGESVYQIGEVVASESEQAFVEYC